MREIDVEKVRAETRGCSDLIHFNNAGASLMPAPVADYLCDFLREEEMKGGYETRSLRNADIEGFYKSVALLLNAKPKEIAFVENATRAWDMVFYALPLGPGDKILTTISEYGSNLIAYLHRAKQTGAELVIVPNDKNGQIDVNALEQNSYGSECCLKSMTSFGELAESTDVIPIYFTPLCLDLVITCGYGIKRGSS